MNEEKETPSMSWGELADLTHETQVSNFGFCTCEDNEGRPNPYEDCPSEAKCLCDNKNVAAQETAEYIAHIYFTKSEKIFNEFMEFIADGKFSGSYAKCADCIRVSD